MRKTIIILLLFASPVWASAPARVHTYTSGTTIRASDVTGNEDAIFTYLQSGVDTISDGSIVNADISSATDISSSKIDWSAITDNITNSGVFSQTGTANFTAITDLGSVTTGDINGGTIDGATLNSCPIGETTPAAGKFTTLEATSTLKLGTTNQGDILYDNGTSLVRLTPGTSGQYLKTQGASANPTWATISGYGSKVAIDATEYSVTDTASAWTDLGSQPTSTTFMFYKKGVTNMYLEWQSKNTDHPTDTASVRAVIDTGASVVGTTKTITSSSYQDLTDTIDISSLTDGFHYFKFQGMLTSSPGSATIYVKNIKVGVY